MGYGHLGLGPRQPPRFAQTNGVSPFPGTSITAHSLHSWASKSTRESTRSWGWRHGQLLDQVVERLQQGKVIGWFQDRFEWGPRALGNRSILGDPRNANMKDIINTKIKFREPYRPFAPSVLAECAEAYFDLPNAAQHYPARYILSVVPVPPAK